jgi:hypothetical protein
MRCAVVPLTIALAGVLLPASIVSQAPPLEIDAVITHVLARDLKFSTTDFADLAQGKIVRRTLDGGASGEIAAVGATRIEVPVDEFLAKFRDIAVFKRHENVLQIGRFSDPPTLDDLSALTVDEADLDGRNCRVGDCDVRLPARDLIRFRRDIDWGAQDAERKAADMFKQMLFEHVYAYWTGSAGRMIAYEDEKRPIKPALEFAGVLHDSPYVGQLVPELPAHLTGFPNARLAGAEDFLYWSKERFGYAPFITVTHVTIAHAPSGSVVITSKDVYSSRYVDASLGLTIAASDRERQDGRFLLVYVNRSRANALRGFLSGLRRTIVERRTRSGLEEMLRSLKTRLESGR